MRKWKLYKTRTCRYRPLNCCICGSEIDIGCRYKDAGKAKAHLKCAKRILSHLGEHGWRTRLPKKDGWYWHFNVEWNEEPSVVYVAEFQGGRSWRDSHGAIHHFLSSDRFFGPLHAPKIVSARFFN